MRVMRWQPNFPGGSVLAVVAIVLAGLCGQAAAQTTKPNYYPPNSDGLSEYIHDMLMASDSNDQERLLLMCQALVLPKPQEWFADVFGKEKGKKLADGYETQTKGFGPSLAKLFLNLNEPKTLKVIVTRIETPEDPDIKLPQLYALQAMQNPVTLYSVLIKKDGTTSTLGLWSIVYYKDNFRFAGKMLEVRDMANSGK